MQRQRQPALVSRRRPHPQRRFGQMSRRIGKLHHHPQLQQQPQPAVLFQQPLRPRAKPQTRLQQHPHQQRRPRHRQHPPRAQLRHPHPRRHPSGQKRQRQSVGGRQPLNPPHRKRQPENRVRGFQAAFAKRQTSVFRAAGSIFSGCFCPSETPKLHKGSP